MDSQSPSPAEQEQAQKQKLRRQVLAARKAQPDKAGASRQAIARLVAMPEYQRAGCVLWYVDYRSEVRTRQALQDCLQAAPGQSASPTPRRIAVPYCTAAEDGSPRLGLWQLKSFDELQAGSYGILEPPKLRWAERERCVAPTDPDMVVVPGVAFTPQGARLGYGQGYYDRLLATVSADCTLVGLAFECQIVDSLPTSRWDVPMHCVVTERRLYS